MHVSELRDRLKQGDIPRVMLFCPGKAPFNGEPFEPLLAERASDAITKLVLPDASLRDMAYSVYHADEMQPGNIAMEAQTLPFLAERRVILVRNADRYSAMSGEKRSPLAPLIEYLQNPSEQTVLMLIASQVDKRKRLYKVCAEAGGIVECPGLTEMELTKWVLAEAARQRKKIAPDAVKELLERTGNRLSDVTNAVTVAANYVGAQEEIRLQDVLAACSDVAEETVWDLTDAIAGSNTDRALKALHQLLELGKSADEIMGIINWLLESAYRAAPETQAQLASRYVAQKVTPLVKKLGVAKLRDACALCTDTHFLIRSTGVDHNLALELLVIKLSAPRRRRPAAARR